MIVVLWGLLGTVRTTKSQDRVEHVKEMNLNHFTIGLRVTRNENALYAKPLQPFD